MAPRAGLAGVLDRLTGPGATPAERWLTILPALIAALLAPAYAWLLDVPWSIFAYVVAALLALDMVGGVITMSTASGQRWYHRPGQGQAAQLGFVAMHLLHLLLVSWLFLGWDPYWLLAAGGWLLFSAVGVLAVPTHLRRPLAMLAYMLALGLALLLLPLPDGLEWFLPLFYLKLLPAYLGASRA